MCCYVLLLWITLLSIVCEFVDLFFSALRALLFLLNTTRRKSREFQQGELSYYLTLCSHFVQERGQRMESLVSFWKIITGGALLYLRRKETERRNWLGKR